MKTAAALVGLALLASCKKASKTAPASGSAGSGSAQATGSGSAEGSGSAAMSPPAPTTFFPAKLDDKQGVAFAETKGGTVEGKAADGTKVSIKDGTRLDVAEVKEADMSTDDAATVDVKVDGKTVALPMGAVLLEGSLTRSPDGKVAVFTYIDSCGDLCHTMLHVVTDDGRRAKLGDGVADRVVAWRKDGKQAAVGSGQLWLVTLPDLTVKHLEKYTAPAYAPDGTLYVRDQDGSAYTLAADGKAKRVWKAKKVAPDEADEYGADDPPPVELDSAGKPKFELPEY
jgi:hypothetical protein